MTTPRTRAWSPLICPAATTFKSAGAGEGDVDVVVEGESVRVTSGDAEPVVTGAVHDSSRATATVRPRI